MATEDQYSPLVQDRKLLNEVKYSARDFASIFDDLLRRLKVEYEEVYNDYATTNQGVMLIELVSWAYAALSWYLDRQASDTYLETARTRAAVERIVEQIGYKMRSASAGSTTLTLTFTNGTSGPFEMKDRWRYQSTSGYQYESYAKVVQPTALSAGDTIDVDVRQGETRTLTYTADGTKNQTYRLASIDEDRYLGSNNIEVWVDGQLWTEKDFLEFDSDTPNHYEVSYLANPPIVRFGDGLAGNIPPAGAEVKIRFLIIDGAKGSVTSGAIQTSLDTLTIGGETVEFTVTNARPASGLDPEKAESAKRWAPVSFAARGAAITQQDYNALANNYTDPDFGGVAKAYAVNPRSSGLDVTFSGLIKDIEDLLDAFSSNIEGIDSLLTSESTSLTAYLSTLSGIHTVLDTYRGAMYGLVGSVDTNTDSVLANVETIEAKTSIAVDNSTTVLNNANSLKISIESGGSTEDMLEYVNNIIYAATNVYENTQDAKTAATGSKSLIYDGILSSLRDLTGYLEDGGDMEDQFDSLSSSISNIGTTVNNIIGQVGFVGDEGESLSDAIGVKIGGISSHLSYLFDDDCRSNYVQVPILELDSDGNYVAPSIGLRNRLQIYLDGIKEVTQVVEVVDGSYNLVGAEIEVSGVVLSGYVKSEVESQTRTVIVGLLKGRDFNDPLNLDVLYEYVRQVVGFKRVNIVITGPSDYIVDGNLVPEENKVIVYGSLSISLLQEE